MAIAVAAGLIGSVLFAFLGFNVSLQMQEWLQPSGRVFITVDGAKVYLEQPNVLVTPMRTSHADAVPSATSSATPTAGASVPGSPPSVGAGEIATASSPATAMAEALLPPVRVAIDGLEIDYPVVVASNTHLPRQPLVGWLYGSALPGTAGNTVLLGHVDGSGATFSRLHELAVGDEIRVVTARAEHIYVVDWLEEVDPNDIGVIGPADEAVVTLITCAGDWLPTERTYDKRLVARAHYADVHALGNARTGD